MGNGNSGEKALGVMNIAISPKDGGVRVSSVLDWVKVTVGIGNNFFEIWDCRPPVLEAMKLVTKEQLDLAKSKRKHSTEDPGDVRKRRNEAQKKFWEVFQTPADVDILEKPINDGEGIAQYISLNECQVKDEKKPKRFLKICRVYGRWMKDPHFSDVRPIPDENNTMTLHFVISSEGSNVDIAEKDFSGIVKKSYRFSGANVQKIEYEVKTKDERPTTATGEGTKPTEEVEETEDMDEVFETPKPVPPTQEEPPQPEKNGKKHCSECGKKLPAKAKGEKCNSCKKEK